MKNNEELQRDVLDAIKWEPLLNAAEIGVIAQNGIITLSGIVDSYAKKTEAEDAAKSVAGVRAVVEKIEIRFEGIGEKTDIEIAAKVLNAIKWNWEVPNDIVKVKVENGWITLEGELVWNYQKEAAKRSVKNLMCVKGVTNNIVIRAETHNEIEKKDIERAIGRNWAMAVQDIEVIVSGKKVILKGNVKSSYQKDEAGRIAWNAPGVWNVENELVVVDDSITT